MDIVRRSCLALPKDQVELAREFYRQLFELAPHARAMFAADMTEQNERLLSAILGAVRNLDRPGLVEDHLRRWGVGHRRMHGVTDDLYPFVAHSLVRALRQIHGHLDTSVGSAWLAVYEWMAAVMIDAADSADAIDRDPSWVIPREHIRSFEAGEAPSDPQRALDAPLSRSSGVA